MRVAFRVAGRVQGVGYRAFALGEARNLGLAGWVRNVPDGTVAGLAEGAEATLARLREALGRGPSWARVDHVHWEVLDAEGSDPSESLPRPFDIRP